MRNLTYRCIDVMKLSKDPIYSQPTTADIDRVCTLISSLGATHVGVSVYMNSTADFVAKGSSQPSSRTVEAFTQQWCTSAHSVGLKVLFRGTFAEIEGVSGFTKSEGSGRYPLGIYSDVVPTMFTDTFTRASVGTDYTATGTWTITSNELIGPTASAWTQLIVTTTSYTNFTVQAKLKKPAGNTQLIFRSDGTNGYGIQLRSTNTFRLENYGISNIAEVTKTLTDGAYYQVKVTCSGTSIKARVWQDGTSEPGTWDIDVTDTTYSTGKIGFSSEITGAVFDDLTITPTASYASWCGRYYQWLFNNPTFFANGDILAPIPEATGGGIFSDATSFVPSTGAGVQANYGTFFNDLKSIGDYFATSQGLTLITGRTGHNWSEVNSGWIPTSVFTTANRVCYDHYGRSGTLDDCPAQQRLSTNRLMPSQMDTDMRSTYTTEGNLVINHQEWSDYWNSNYYAGVSVSNEERFHFLIRMYKIFKALADEGKYELFNYWGGWENADYPTLEGIFYKDGAGTYQLRGRAKLLGTFFTGNGTTRIPVTDVDGNY